MIRKFATPGGYRRRDPDRSRLTRSTRAREEARPPPGSYDAENANTADTLSAVVSFVNALQKGAYPNIYPYIRRGIGSAGALEKEHLFSDQD